ncbi:hypothetical protein JTE90_015871 [Oedothorax gibbosus]|uniref:BPTI/Kunitz inhibitor domain-containing protein n=1 Tax=Oedothorax gibbosus TaxID=931172 RepID=A0AAV6VUW2_9ARAC|nr:hypothetical protein JTE90_015871 [Oedothorax gibbosus]
MPRIQAHGIGLLQIKAKISSFLKYVCLLVVLSSLCSITNAAECEICHLQAVTGRCRASFPMYYYNVNTYKCEMFIYGGCGGNENRFRTLEECSNACPINAQNAVECDVCQLQGETGPCRAGKIMFYFNVNQFQCEKFVYGGCQGNANRFKTMEDCMNSCGLNN